MIFTAFMQKIIILKVILKNMRSMALIYSKESITFKNNSLSFFFIKKLLTIIFISSVLIINNCSPNIDKNKFENFSLFGLFPKTEQVPVTPQYFLGGSVSNLQGSGLVLNNSGIEKINITSSGSFQFAQKMNIRSNYNVSIDSQPVNPAQVCSIRNGYGVISSNVYDMQIDCAFTEYYVDLNVTGLKGIGLSIQNNQSEILQISANGVYSFKNPIAITSSYNLEIKTYPVTPNQSCSLSSPSGNYQGNSRVRVNVTCYIANINISSIATSVVTTNTPGKNSTSISWSSDKSGTYFLMVSGTCASGTLATGNSVDGMIYLNTTNVSVIQASQLIPGTNTISICIKDLNGIIIGERATSIIRDDVPPVSSFNPASKSSNAPITIYLTCSDNCSRVAYSLDGITIPDFDSNGNVVSGQLFSGLSPIVLNASINSYTLYARAFDQAGNKETNPVTATYSVGTGMPLITSVSVDKKYISAFGYTQAKVFFYTDVPGGNFNLRVNATDCSTGAVAYTGTTALTGYSFGTIDVSNLSSGNNSVIVCVANLTNTQTGYLALVGGINRDDTAPSVNSFALSALQPNVSSAVSFTFSAGDTNLDISSLTAQSASGACSGNIQVSYNDFSTCVAGTISYGGVYVYFYPSPRLEHGRFWKGRITTGVKDQAGNPIASQWTSSFSASNYSNALTGLYLLDNNGNNSITGINNTLTITNPQSTSDENGISSGAYDFNFNASREFVSASNVLSGVSDNVTLSAWVNWRGINTGANQIIVHAGKPGTDGYGIIINSTGNLGILSASNITYTSTPLPMSTWAHVAAVRYSGSWSLYLNGKLLTTNNPTMITTASNGQFYVGGGVIGANQFEGKISDAAFAGFAFSATEIGLLAIQNTTSLIANFSFSGSSIVEDIKNIPVTLSGTVNKTIDRFSQVDFAYYFNGGYIQANSSLITLPSGNAKRTLCAWILPESNPTGSDIRTILEYGSASTENLFSLRIINNSGNVYLSLKIDSASGVDARYQFPTGTGWTHVCGGYDGTKAFIFINGYQYILSSLNMNTASGTYLQIGSDISGANFFIGKIDEVKLYDKQLSQNEIKALSGYHPIQASVSSTNGLLLHLQADSISGNTGDSVGLWADQGIANLPIDASKIGINGVPTFDASAMNGKPALTFVGNQYLGNTTANVGALKNTNAMTYAIVFKRASVNPTESHTATLIGKGTNAARFFFDVPTSNKFMLGEFGFSPVVSSVATTFGQNSPSPISVLINTNTGMLVNGKQEAGSVIRADQSFTTNVTNELYIGSPDDGLSINDFKGQISEIIYFNSALTAANNLIVACYLSAKYSIPIQSSLTSICP